MMKDSVVVHWWCSRRSLSIRLHFVRNHAAVPQLHWETHTVLVYADPAELLSKPREWTMDELTSGDFKVIEIPVTIGCDGSRYLPISLPDVAN